MKAATTSASYTISNQSKTEEVKIEIVDLELVPETIWDELALQAIKEGKIKLNIVGDSKRINFN